MLDANALPDRQQLTTRVCIVGGGAAGIAAALELADAGVDVLLLESGPPARVVPSTHADPAAPDKLDHPAEPSGLHAFGGHTGRRAARCRALPEHELAARPWIPDSGWPVTADELSPFYGRARLLCESPATALLPDHQADAPLIDGLQTDEFDSRTVDRYAHPGDFGSRHRLRIANARRLTILTGATVTALLLNEAGTAVTRVAFRNHRGALMHVHTRTVVLAGGALETTRLLLASRDIHREGVGNGRGNVGRYLICALRGTLGTLRLLRPLDPIWIGARHQRISRAALALTAAAQHRHQLPSFAVRLRPLASTVLTTRLRTRLTGACAAGTPLRVDWQCEQMPTAAGRIVPSERSHDPARPMPVDIEWQPGTGDASAVRRALGLFDETLRKSGIGSFDHDPASLASALVPPEVPIEHLLGGARMGHDPRHSVTDADGRVHGVDNLFVTGTPVFPTSGLDNPLLTLVALAIRLADHLKTREARDPQNVVSIRDHFAGRFSGRREADEISASGTAARSQLPAAGAADAE